MPLMDDRGRLFGRFNVIDVFVAFVVLLLIPLAYGAYVLFRTPPPTISGIEPTRLTPGADLRVEVKGEHLRPYMRVQVGSERAEFLAQTPYLGEIKLPALAPGVYDVTFLDEAEELVRLPAALTIETPEHKQQSADVAVRFVMPPEWVDVVKVGDIGQGRLASRTASSGPQPDGDTATLTSISPQRKVRSLVSIGIDPDPARPTGVSPQVEQEMITFDAMVKLTTQDTPMGWRHNDLLMKPGALFSFETREYTIRGWVLKITPLPADNGTTP